MGLTDEIKDLKSQLKELEDSEIFKKKKFSFPFGKKVSQSQRNNNFVTVLVINENGTYDFAKYQIKDQTFMHNKIPRLASAGYTMFDKRGNPLLILPSWSVQPFSPLENYNQTLINGSNTTGYELLMDKMLKEQTSTKLKMNVTLKWILGFGLVAIIIYALLAG
jgi:hypothetical protein